jgi:hypothetical protein
MRIFKASCSLTTAMIESLDHRYKDNDMVIIPQTHSELASVTPIDYSTIPYNELPDPGVAFNEWPNGPWNTTHYDWHAEYPVCSPEWFAQQSAKSALKCGLQYGTRDRSQEQKDNLEQYLIARGDRLSTPKKEIPVMQRAGIADSKNGILTDTHLYRYINGKIIKTPCDGNTLHNASDIMQIAFTYNLRTVWVLSGTELSRNATSDFITVSGDWQLKGNPQWTKGTKKNTPLCKFVAGYQEGQRTAYVGFLEYNIDWGLQKVHDPVVALATLSYIEDALGVAVLYSAGKCGVYLMEKVNKKKRVDWIEKIDIRGIVPLREKLVCVGDLDWKRELTEEDTGYLVSFDKNMAYPASCTSVLLGTGNPVYQKSPHFDQKKAVPGVWHCKISGTSEFDGVNLPHPTNGKTEGWFYTYTVKLLFEVGYQVEITEAYVWQEYHTILRPFAEKLFSGREVLDDTLASDTTRYKNVQARKIASKCIKFIAVKSLGWTRMLKDLNETEEELDWYIRPDWDDLVIDNARYQMCWRIRKCIAKGYYPVGVHADCLYFTSPTSDHEQALPLLDKPMMERRKKLGGYKQHYQTPITVEEIKPIFARNKAMSTTNTELIVLDNKHMEGKN